MLSSAAASIAVVKGALGFISCLNTGQKREGAANEQQPWEVTAHVKWGSLRWGSADAVPPRVTLNGHMWIQEEAVLKDKLTQAFSLFKGSKTQIVGE